MAQHDPRDHSESELREEETAGPDDAADDRGIGPDAGTPRDASVPRCHRSRSGDLP
jgi:hypothetical protein